MLVEHDVTFDLFGQIARRDGTLSSWGDYWRWFWLERRLTKRYHRVVVMSERDAKLLGPRAPAVEIENGVDLERFRAEPNGPGSTCSS